MKIIFSKKFLKYFVISFASLLVLLLLQLLLKYSEDIFNKGFPMKEIMKLIYHSSLSLFGFSLLFGFLIASIFSFRYYSKTGVIGFKKELKSGVALVILFSFALFGFNNWILPKSNLEMRVLLYEMQSTAPGKEIRQVDKNLFKNNQSLMSIKTINLKIDTFKIEIEELKYQCDSLLKLLPNPIAKEQYDKLNLKKYGVKYNCSSNDTISEQDYIYASNYLNNYQRNLRFTFNEKRKFEKEKSSRYILSIELILLFLIGASFGYLYRDQKSFLLIILGLYTISFFLGTTMGFESMISHGVFENLEGKSASMIVLVITTTVFLMNAIKKEQKKTQPNI